MAPETCARPPDGLGARGPRGWRKAGATGVLIPSRLIRYSFRMKSLYQPVLRLSRALFRWPPQSSEARVKHALVARLGRRHQLANLVETGTSVGDMVEAQRENFRAIVTIELAQPLAEAAGKRFAAFPHIRVLQGDSGTRLADALRLIEGPALYWLDGHYSGGVTARGSEETPIQQELALIAARNERGDVILIDDARLFGWRSGYPSLRRIRRFVSERLPRHSLRVESDVICIEPAAGA